MKILLVNWQDPRNPKAGGAEIHLLEVFRRLRERGHEVEWLVSGWPGAAERDEIDGMQVHRTGSRYTFGLAAPPFYRTRLAKRRYDVVVEALNKVPVYAPIWADAPVVLLVHHLFGTTAFREAAPPLAAMTWLQERPLRRVYRDCPVQAISRSTADDLVARGLDEARIEVIHPGVDLDFFRPPTSPSRTVPPTFLYLGRLQRYKGVDLIVRAFAGARLTLEGARLVIAGRGDREEALRSLAERLGVSDHVEFTGYVSEARKRELFQCCWANLFVSPKEGWGITNLEAAACGTPTIASDAPGLRESVVHGRTGLLVPHGDVRALELAMCRLGSDPAYVETLGTEARSFASGFDWDRTALATERGLAGAIGRARPPRATGAET